MLKKHGSLIFSEYKIVFDNEELNKKNDVTPEIKKLLESTIKKVFKNKKKTNGKTTLTHSCYMHCLCFVS